MNNDLVKSPYAALRCIPRLCGVRKSTPHSVGFARLASGAFYKVVRDKGTIVGIELIVFRPTGRVACV
jgi:hypothetical protein